jgi:MFS family permease
MTGLLLRAHGIVVSGAVLSAFNLVGGISQYAARHFRPRRTMIAGVLATIAGAAAIDLALETHSLAVFFVATLFAGIGAALVFVGSLSVVNELSPTASRAETVTAYSMSGYLALAIPTVALGLLVSHIGLRGATAVFAPLLVLAGLATLVSLTRHQGANETEPVLRDGSATLPLGLPDPEVAG